MKKIYILLILFNSYVMAETLSVEEMVDSIIKEQFLTQQEDTMKNSMHSMLESMGFNVESEAMDSFLNPLINEYITSIEKKVPALYREVYTDSEIVALYNFMKTKDGASITSKQSLMAEKIVVMVSEDSMKLSENIGIAFQENPELVESLIR